MDIRRTLDALGVVKYDVNIERENPCQHNKISPAYPLANKNLIVFPLQS